MVIVIILLLTILIFNIFIEILKRFYASVTFLGNFLFYDIS